MNNTELLSAISDLLDSKLDEKLDARFDAFEKKLDAKLEAKLDHVDSRLIRVEKKVRDIGLILENDMQPRLRHIESCYVDTFKRYVSGIEEQETL